MIPLPTDVRVSLLSGHTDMTKGFLSLSLQVQKVLRRDPLSGHLFCFRDRDGDFVKVIWHDGRRACLFTKKLERFDANQISRSSVKSFLGGRCGSGIGTAYLTWPIYHYTLFRCGDAPCSKRAWRWREIPLLDDATLQLGHVFVGYRSPWPGDAEHLQAARIALFTKVDECTACPTSR